MTSRTEINCKENTSFPAYATLEYYNGSAYVPILSAQVDSIEMTLVNVNETTLATSIVNSRQKQDVFDDNDCTFHATTGLFTWDVRPEDTEIVGSTPINAKEKHLATFTVTWDTTKKMHFEILLIIENLRSVPQVSA